MNRIEDDHIQFVELKYLKHCMEYIKNEISLFCSSRQVERGTILRLVWFPNLRMCSEIELPSVRIVWICIRLSRNDNFSTDRRLCNSSNPEHTMDEM